MLETRYHWLPIILVIYLPLTIVITYSIAVAYDHVEPGFPYISDTGSFPPESCVFGQLLNFGAVVCGLIVYIRYKHILELYGDVLSCRCLMKVNTASFIVGLLVILGVSLVANFQETSVVEVHLAGAFLAFAVGFIYCILQTFISFKTPDMPGTSPVVRNIRVLLCVADFVFLVILSVASTMSRQKGPGPQTSPMKWTAADPGYAEHLVATVSEWLLALVTVFFFATFYKEFRHFRVISPSINYYHSVKKRSTEESHSVATIS